MTKATTASTLTDPRLGPVSMIVLGLLAEHGEGTSYDLKRWVERSIGYFWSFPHSQLYAEPKRLTALGFLTEHQQETGRRKRTYRITPAGQAALQTWFATPTEAPEIRDPALLKLFFSDLAPSGTLRHLSEEQIQRHQAAQTHFKANDQADDLSKGAKQALQFGLLAKRGYLEFWSSVKQQEEQA